MGKTSKPLSILIHPSLDGPDFDKLREQGHLVDVMGSAYTNGKVEHSLDYDLILSPTAWRMLPELLKYLPITLKAARKVKYGKHDETVDG